LRTPLAGVVRTMWAAVTKKSLRNLISVAETR
jgi:hypothetical protein